VQWKPFTFDGTTYELTHLYPRSCCYQQPAKAGKPARSYDVDIIFSLHCFTRAIDPSETPDAAMLYGDNRETRIFDFQRYELSKRLPAILETLAQRKCYHTGKGNFFSVDVINENGTVTEYDVFFAASRSSKKGRLNLFVQSAYGRDAQHGSNRPHKKPIGLYVILFNVLHNKPIKVPPQ